MVYDSKDTRSKLVSIKMGISAPWLLFRSGYFSGKQRVPARSPGPSGAPPPTRSGPDPLSIHPRPTRPRGTSQPPVHAAGAGKPAHRDLLRGCWQNQYNKLLGIVRITLREFGSDRFQYSKVLEMMTSSNFQYLTIHVMIDPKAEPWLSHISK